MTAQAVGLKRRWNTEPRWWRLFHNFTFRGCQIRDLVELNRLQTRIGDRQRRTGYCVAGLEMVFGVSAFAHTNKEFSPFTADITVDSERIAQIGVTTLMERAVQSDP